MTTVGYIRRSHAGEAEVSEKVQRQTITRQAEGRGLTVDHWYMDWGRSGLVPDGVGDTLPEILAHRPQALKMMRDLEAGGVGAILAYRQDRLARDSFTVQLMIRVARRHDVPILIPRGDITAREQRLLTAVEGGMDEEEGTRAKERAGAANDTIVERGDDRGGVPYGWSKVTLTKNGVNSRGEPAKAGARVLVKTNPDAPAHVVDVFRAEGSYNAAARRLNDEGVTPPNPKHRRNSAGAPMWSAPTVRDIVQREAPDLAKRTTAARRPKQPLVFRRLLRCHCGAPMSASANPRGNQYYCNRGKRGAHQPYSISELKLRPWIEAEAAKLRLPSEVEVDVEVDADDSADLAAINALRAAGRDEMADELQRDLEVRRVERGQRQRIVQAVPPALDWDWSVEAINAWLRAAFTHIELGADLLPVRAEWAVPEWRS